MIFPDLIGPHQKLAVYDFLSGYGIEDSVLFRVHYSTELLGTDNNTDLPSKSAWCDPLYLKGFNHVYNHAGTLSKKLFKKTKINAQDQTHSEKLKSETWSSNRRPENKLPLIIFCHGVCGNRFMYSHLCNNLASLGYVVVAIEHRDQSASLCSYLDEKDNRMKTFHYLQTEFMENHKFLQKSEVNEKLFAQVTWQTELRVKEVEMALEELRKLHEGTGKNFFLGKDRDTGAYPTVTAFKGQLDLDNVSLVGHSFGSSTIAKVIVKFPPRRFRKIIFTDLWGFPINITELTKLKEEYPDEEMLFLNSEIWWSIPFSTKIYTMLDQKLRRGESIQLYSLKGSAHQSFADMPYPLKNLKLYPRFLMKKQFGAERNVKYMGQIIVQLMEKFLTDQVIDLKEMSLDKQVKQGLYDDGFSKDLGKIRANYALMVEKQISV